MDKSQPRILVFSTLFPSSGTPNTGLFIRERMFKVRDKIPIIVVSPRPWFPGQGLIRYFRPHFRPQTPKQEIQNGTEVFYPLFFSVPGVFKSLDGFFMALGSLPTLLRLKKKFNFNIVDSHFAYPDGYAAGLLGKWLKTPITITLRGTEVPQAKKFLLRHLMLTAIQRASRVFSVSNSLKQHVVSLGADADKINVIGNGVDTDKFNPMQKYEARRQLNIDHSDIVLISVGGLVERKGFHRMIELLPAILQKYQNLKYLIVGGPNPEGDWSERLRQQVIDLNLESVVRFLGTVPSIELKVPLSASDVFVLPTSNEGWANVFLEAMACGLPVVTTDVGGNNEVVCSEVLGTIVPFGDAFQLQSAVTAAITKEWDTESILNYAAANSWDSRVNVLEKEFTQLVSNHNH